MEVLGVKRALANIAKHPARQTSHEEHASRMARQKAKTLWREAEVRERHARRQVSQSAAWDNVLANIQRRLGNGILVALIGARGTGKTQLAVECIRAAVAPPRLMPARYATAMEIFVSIRDAYRTGASEAVVQARYQRPALLVIDEAQERGDTAWEDRVLTAIVDHRYSMLRDTIIISNLTRAAFEQSMGASIVSRMIETGGIVECKWESFRKRGV